MNQSKQQLVNLFSGFFYYNNIFGPFWKHLGKIWQSIMYQSFSIFFCSPSIPINSPSSTSRWFISITLTLILSLHCNICKKTRSKFDHSLRQSTWDILILHFRTSFRTTEVDYRLAAAIAPRAKKSLSPNFPCYLIGELYD